MTEDFREAVERHTCENPDTECIDRHLTTLFDDLKGHTAYTYNITKKLGIDRVYEQRDAAEYFEKILCLTSPDASPIFHGLLTNKTTCSECRTETGNDEAFWHLPLALVDSCSEDYSVVNGIEEYFRASDFSGENQMYCDQCDAKTDATTKCVIKHHPEVLMLLLKRFEFDYRYMTYVKINCIVDVPYTLHIPENQTYELYAVVEHFGDLRSGCYTAAIKDDERWYNFNDVTVTLFDNQPFQVDNIEKSGSAYLLFYRKKDVHAADNCTQDIREVSTPGGFPPATSDIHDQCQDTVKIREREEVEGAAEVGNASAVAVSIDRNEETGIKDMGLSPDHYYNVEDRDNRAYTRQSIADNHHEYNEERNDLRYHPQDAQAEKQKDERKLMMEDKEDKKRGTLSRETQLEKSVKVQEKDSGRLDDVRQRRADISHDVKPEVSDKHAIHDHLNKQQEMSDAQGRVMAVKTDKDGKTGDDEQSEKRERSLPKNPDSDAENQDNEGLDNVRQNINEAQEGTVGQDYDLEPVSVNKEGDEESMEINVKVHKDRKTGADRRGMASGTEKLLTKYELCYDESQDNGRVGESKQNMPKDDQRCKQGSSSRYTRHEQQREEKGDVQGVKGQKRGDDQHAQRRETFMTKPYLPEGIEDQDKRRLDDVRQNRPEPNISQISLNVGVDRLAKEQEKKGYNELIQNRESSSVRQVGSRKLTENQRVGSVEKTRQGNSESKARTGFKKDTMEGKRGSKQSRTCNVKIIEEEIKITPSGVQKSRETKHITIEGTSQDGIKSWEGNNEGNVKIKSDPKTGTKFTLSKGVCDLKLSESPLPEQQTSRTKGVSDAKVKAGKHAMKEGRQKKTNRWFPYSSRLQKHSKEKTKQKETTGCFSLFRKSRKNADQTSESD